MRKRRDYRAVYDHGRRARATSLTLFGSPNRLGYCRLGITVTRKVGGAVKRNRVKRRLREIFRHHRSEMRPAMDLVVNAHPSIRECAMREIEREFLNSFRRLARGAEQ